MELCSEGVATMIFTLLLIYNTSLTASFEIKSIFCSISDSCDCDFKPDIKGLEWDLYKNLYGQHMAQDIVSEAVVSCLQNENPDRPLVLSFHGASGTGKSLVSSMVGRHIYGTAMGSPYIHQYVPTLHFSSADRVQQYRSDLKQWVERNLTACARSIFIFDEMEKMPPGVIDVLEPHLGPFHVLFQTNYRKAIYIFISTVGQEIINKFALESQQAGRDREEIRPEELEEVLADAVYNTRNSGFYQSRIITEKLVTRFVPFLPLRRRHVERCAQRELCQRGECHRTDVVSSVGGAMNYMPQDSPYFSSTGCKLVPAKVNLFL
ncbi:prosalusin [Triplophysa rosa]|uniref:Torsin n=1 Tax=Triplophysa rosa TaxID=992332 RepID=A0A9W7X2R1_TRIRA|nr:prosalusin [Triplophysa rosa]KAI7812734.1 prosalusin precursor [Triplophysa rosa]